MVLRARTGCICGIGGCYEGLGLDSVDALELGLAVQKTFGFQLDGEKDQLRNHFASVQTLADFVRSRQVEKE